MVDCFTLRQKFVCWISITNINLAFRLVGMKTVQNGMKYYPLTVAQR